MADIDRVVITVTTADKSTMAMVKPGRKQCHQYSNTASYCYYEEPYNPNTLVKMSGTTEMRQLDKGEWNKEVPSTDR